MRSLRILILWLVALRTATATGLFGALRSGGQPVAQHSIEEALFDYIDGRTQQMHIIAYFENYQRWRQHFADVKDVVLLHQQRYPNNMTFILNEQRAELPQPYKHNLCYVDTLWAFSKMLPLERLLHGSDKQFYVIMLQRDAETVREYRTMMNAIFYKLYKRQVIDVLVIVESSPGVHLVYTASFFERRNCRSHDPIMVNVFQNGSFLRPTLFSSAQLNLNQCPLRVMPNVLPPYFMQDPVSGAPNGVEWEILKILAKSLNFTPVLVPLPRNTISDVAPDGTAYGSFQQLRLGKVDILIGAYMYTTLRGTHFASVSYFREPLVVVRRRPLWWGTPAPLLQLLTIYWLPWLCIGCGILVVICSASRYRRWRRLADTLDGVAPAAWRDCSWLHVFGSTMGSPVPWRNFSHSLRCSIAMWCFGFMVFNSMYQGRLYAIYNQQSGRGRTTMQQIINEGYTFLAPNAITESMFTNALNVPPHQVVSHAGMPVRDVYERVRNSSDQLALIANLRSFRYYMRANNIQSIFDILGETISVHSMSAYFQPNSFMVPFLTTVIYKLRGNGIILKWFGEAESKLKPRIRPARFHALSLNELRPIFLILFTGQVVSIVVWLLELFWAHCKRQRRGRPQRTLRIWQ